MNRPVIRIQFKTRPECRYGFLETIARVKGSRQVIAHARVVWYESNGASNFVDCFGRPTDLKQQRTEVVTSLDGVWRQSNGLAILVDCASQVTGFPQNKGPTLISERIVWLKLRDFVPQQHRLPIRTNTFCAGYSADQCEEECAAGGYYGAAI